MFTSTSAHSTAPFPARVVPWSFGVRVFVRDKVKDEDATNNPEQTVGNGLVLNEFGSFHIPGMFLEHVVVAIVKIHEAIFHFLKQL